MSGCRCVYAAPSQAPSLAPDHPPHRNHLKQRCDMRLAIPGDLRPLGDVFQGWHVGGDGKSIKMARTAPNSP